MLINYPAAALAVVSRRETLTPQCVHPDCHCRGLSAETVSKTVSTNKLSASLFLLLSACILQQLNLLSIED